MASTLTGPNARVVRKIDQNRLDPRPNHSQLAYVDRPATKPSRGGPMPQPATSRFSIPKPIATLIAAVAVALCVFGATMPAQAATSKRVAKEAHSAKLHETILVNLKGLTLYSLSAETHGKFICKGSCLKIWHPLYFAAGVKPTGPVKLGTIKRPDNGKRQVTFDGRPLYTFEEDKKAGDVKGQGIKDVGTWHAASP
jgi:predicted lipoprotein with Yx(FWY)xxD motif